MYITSIVFTLIAWGAGLLLDANIHFGDPQGFLCLRVLLPVLAMGLCLLRAIKENKRDGDKWKGEVVWSALIVKKKWYWVISNVGMVCIGHWRSSLLHHFLLWAREALAFPMAQQIIPTPYLRSSAKIAKKSLLTIRVKDNYSAYKSEHMKPPFDDDFAC